MALLRSFHKSAFWSPFLLGLLAILTLPADGVAREARDTTIFNEQAFSLSEVAEQNESEQAAFLILTPTLSHFSYRQAVEFCKFSAKPYRLLSVTQPPIRAGPLYFR